MDKQPIGELGLLDLFSRRLILGRATGFFMALTIPKRSACAQGASAD